MKFEIKSRWDANVLFSLETDSLKLCIEAAVKSRANLSGANLSGANLSRADLSGADLYGADLYGEKLTKNPIQLLGLKWPILITEVHIKIGCEVHKAAEWEKFKDSRITLMDSSALEWWNNHKKLILNLHKLHAGSKP